jgi:hypothetical protein
MAITTTLTNSAKMELLSGTHNFSSNTFKMALIKVGASGTYDKNVTNYGSGSGSPTTANLGTDEFSGSTYVAGGFTMSGVAVTQYGDTATISWSTNPNWTTATISAIGAFLYNSTASGKAIAMFDFGGTVTSTAGTFTITLPAAGASTSIIRIA